LTCFIDTSGFFALFDADDSHHVEAARQWEGLLDQEAVLVTTSYVLVETMALMQRRLGIEAVRRFQSDVYPLLNVVWLDETFHSRAVESLLTAGARDLSLVDCASFAVMRNNGWMNAMAFDRHFKEQGFRCG
jgi:predicted nucleic acid-binding protein